MINFVYFGTPLFSKIVLEKLINNNYLPLALITNPDRPVGRKKIITPPETKKLILEKKLENKIKIFQPEILDEKFINSIQNLNPLFGIVCAYSKIIPGNVLNIFKKGVLGVHPSLLPKYRGPSPIQSAILNGEKESGTTIYLLDDKMDHGPILIQEKINIENLDYQTSSLKLAELGGDLLVKILPDFIENKITFVPQDENLATYT
ncbi:MAG: methionyl-tRNA formyltransferase, partial [Minisyncoccia bacterium]